MIPTTIASMKGWAVRCFQCSCTPCMHGISIDLQPSNEYVHLRALQLNSVHVSIISCSSHTEWQMTHACMASTFHLQPSCVDHVHLMALQFTIMYVSIISSDAWQRSSAANGTCMHGISIALHVSSNGLTVPAAISLFSLHDLSISAWRDQNKG